jgi:hypothetical protein
MSETTFQVPEGTAEEAKASTTDELAADTKAADKKVEYPEGAPKFLPLHRLGYGARGRATRALADAQQYLKDHPDVEKTETEGEQEEAPGSNLYEVADQMDMLELLDKFLALTAADPDAYAAWEPRLDGAVLLQTWQAYHQERQTGEASSSSS